MMILILNSGVIKYFIIFLFINLFCGILTVILGFFGFLLLFLSLIITYFIIYLFRYEDHVIDINNNNLYVSPTDGRIVKITENIGILPDIIENNQEYIKKNTYTLIEIQSNLNNIFFKTSPLNGIINKIKIIEPRTININSNFKHLSHRKYIIFEIENQKNEILILIFEIPYVDKNFNLYEIYVKEGDTVKQDTILICIHFYSYIFFYVPAASIKNTINQSLFYGETLIQTISENLV
jgi:hypothetical protein